MKNLSRVCLLLCAMSATAIFASDLAETPRMITPPLVGTTLPDAPMVTPDGEKTTLAEYTKGKKTVLVFYRGDW